jgi:hypothetical protein
MAYSKPLTVPENISAQISQAATPGGNTTSSPIDPTSKKDAMSELSVEVSPSIDSLGTIECVMFCWYLLEDILVLAESESVVIAMEKGHPYFFSYSSIYYAQPLPLRIHNSKTYIQLKATVIKVIKNVYYKAFAAKQITKADFSNMLQENGNGAIGFQFPASGNTKEIQN